MTLYETLNNARRFAWNIPKLIEIIWRELNGLDERINDVEEGTVAEGSIGTSEIAAGAATKTKIGYKVVTVNVSTGNANGSSSADPDLVGGEIIGIISAGNQDQLLDNVALNGDGSVTATLADNATAQNNFKVTVLKP